MPTPSAPSRLVQLHDSGQSLWLDFIDRTILLNGDLARRIRDDALTGMTSNPTIFEKALAEGTAYDAQLRLRARPGITPPWDSSSSWRPTMCARRATLSGPSTMPRRGADGFVSIEVSPGVAGDAAQQSQKLAASGRRLTART